jgi:hydrogenase maturation protein HypF
MPKPLTQRSAAPRQRLRLTIRGAVQGVGFRPFVYRLAMELELTGWVNNSPQGVFIEVEGARATLDQFRRRVNAEKPPRAFIQSLEASLLDPCGFQTFEIRESEQTGAKTSLVLPDSATCSDCTREIFDPANRRYQYPFTNCTNCGPRFSIIQALPYDRANTTMRAFEMCPACAAEYHDPRDRRFHAQPNACPACGPQLALWDANGAELATQTAALQQSAAAVRAGQIVAVKGLGGFHLLCDARNDDAVQRLRQRKHREEKPFAVMFPSRAALEQVCEVSELETQLLGSPEAPIVLLQRKAQTEAPLSKLLAPHNPYLGALLPYTPLHQLLLAELGFPVVATSGNLSDEPICIAEHEALERLRGIADVLLVHNRPITRHVDDSIVRVLAGREMVLRRARGFAPLPLRLPQTLPATLAVGAHLKNTIALAVGQDAFASQHIGDLETAQAYGAFQQVISSFEQLYETQPQSVVCDAHPSYLSTQFAQAASLPLQPVQHHLAHVMACVAENEIPLPVLGVAWDGTGYGLDGTIWGGEFLRVEPGKCERAAHFRTFGLPGGEAAVKQPKRIALGALYEIFGKAAFEHHFAPLAEFSQTERTVLQMMLRRQVNTPRTSSAGRLFDAVASLVNLRHVTRFEGQAAMELEFALAGLATDECYPFEFRLLDAQLIFDWEPLLRAVWRDTQAGTPIGLISARFHNTLAEAIVEGARRCKLERVALSGGCFQNKYLLERSVNRLRAAGLQPYWPQRVPPNDGGIALGQLAAAAFQISFKLN